MAIAGLKKSDLYVFYNTVTGMQSKETFGFLSFTRALRNPEPCFPLLNQLQAPNNRPAVIYLTTNTKIKFKSHENTDIISQDNDWVDNADMIDEE